MLWNMKSITLAVAALAVALFCRAAPVRTSPSTSAPKPSLNALTAALQPAVITDLTALLESPQFQFDVKAAQDRFEAAGQLAETVASRAAAAETTESMRHAYVLLAAAMESPEDARTLALELAQPGPNVDTKMGRLASAKLAVFSMKYHLARVIAENKRLLLEEFAGETSAPLGPRAQALVSGRGMTLTGRAQAFSTLAEEDGGQALLTADAVLSDSRRDGFAIDVIRILTAKLPRARTIPLLVSFLERPIDLQARREIFLSLSALASGASKEERMVIAAATLKDLSSPGDGSPLVASSQEAARHVLRSMGEAVPPPAVAPAPRKPGKRFAISSTDNTSGIKIAQDMPFKVLVGLGALGLLLGSRSIAGVFLVATGVRLLTLLYTYSLSRDSRAPLHAAMNEAAARLEAEKGVAVDAGSDEVASQPSVIGVRRGMTTGFGGVLLASIVWNAALWFGLIQFLPVLVALAVSVASAWVEPILLRIGYNAFLKTR